MLTEGCKLNYADVVQEDVGQPGCTDAERHRLEGILRAGYVALYL